MPTVALREDKKSYFKSSKVNYLAWDVQFPKFWNIFTKLLRYALSRKFDYEPVLKRGYAKNLKGFKRKALRLFSYLFPKNFFNPELFSILETFLMPIPGEFRKLCAKHEPVLILTASPGFNPYDAEAITLGKKMSIPTVAINFSWDNFHNGAHNIRKTDFLILWNEIMKKEAIAMQYYNPNRVFISGPIRFDHYFINENSAISREEFLTKKNLNSREKTILITTVTDGNYPLEQDVVKQVLQKREKGEFPGFPNIFIRLHPKDTIEKYKQFKQYKSVCVEEAGKWQAVGLGSNIEMDENDLLNLKYTILYSDVLINYASTISLEAFVFDKPVVNIGFPAKYLDAYSFTHYKQIIDAQAVKLAKSVEELVQGVSAYLKDPLLDVENRKKIFNEFLFFHDGLSYKRNVDFLEKIIKKYEI